jgi:hypothetical protein
MRSKFFFALTWLVFSTMAIAQDKAQLQIGGSTIDVSIDPAPSPDLRKLILDWIATAARAVTRTEAVSIQGGHSGGNQRTFQFRSADR